MILTDQGQGHGLLMPQRLTTQHQALEQVRQGAGLKELSRALYEDRLGDILTVKNEQKEGEERGEERKGQVRREKRGGERMDLGYTRQLHFL